MGSVPLLELVDLTVSVGGKDVLKGVSLFVQPGETHVLLGPNGSGKSSLLAAVMGLPPWQITGGEVRFARAADMAIDLDVVRWVRKDHARLRALHQGGHACAVETVPTGESIAAKLPDISKTDPTRCTIGQDVVFRVPRLLSLEPGDERIDFAEVEASHPNVEPEFVEPHQEAPQEG